MSETAEVRLLRCPKCENLLPEVTGYSVYRCGGCGAVLRAGDKGVDLDSFSERSDEEKVAMMKEKYMEIHEEKNSMSDMRMIGQGDGMSSISSSSRAAGRALMDSAEIYGGSLMDRENMWEHRGGMIQGRDLDEFGRPSVARDLEDLTLYNDGENRLRRLDQVLEEHDSSSLVSRPGGAYEFEGKNRIGADGFNKDGYVGGDRPKILRGLDGRNERLGRYGYLNDRGKGKTFLDRPIAHEDFRSGSENWYPNKSLGVNSSSGQYPYLGTRFNRPSYQNQYPEPSLMHRLEMAGDGFNPSPYPLNRVQEYEGPLRSQMLRRGFREPPPYQQPSTRPYSSGSYPGDDMVYLDPFEPYKPGDNHHHPSCSCFHCFNTKQVPQPVAFSDKFSDVSVDSMFNYHKNPGPFSPRDYNFPATIHHPLRSHNPLSHTRWPSDLNSEEDGFMHRHPPTVHSASAAVLHCRPVGGGAPFLVCFNCFELLLLPKNVATNSDRRKKVKCGECSVVIVIAFSNNKLVVCDDVEATTDSPLKLDDNSNTSPIRGELYMHGHLKQVRTTFSSDDYDNTGYDFVSMDRELEQPSPGRGRGSGSSEVKHQNSESNHSNEVEKVTVSANVLSEDSRLTYEETMNKELPPPPVGSSLQEYCEYSNKFHVKNLQGSHKKYLPSKTTRQQSSINDSSAATETDVSSNEFSNTGTSFDSDEASRKGRRASESFFAGIVKKSFKEFSRSNQNAEQENNDVTINGHRLPSEIIKKAEEVAGPIHPGQYWYDYLAGFWGLMGGPCLGIIPPGIEEFNHPMPEKCAGGNTGIYVNGRELHQKDLHVLKRRGLPTERNRSYTVEISGRVINEDTGQELKSLGKLAPTVEKLQRGFGMRVPKGAPRS